MRMRCACQSRAGARILGLRRRSGEGRHEPNRRRFVGLRSLKFCRRRGSRDGAKRYGGDVGLADAAHVVGRSRSRGHLLERRRDGHADGAPRRIRRPDARHDHAREDRRDRRGARSPLQSAGRQRRVAPQHLAAAAFDLRHVRPQQQTPVAHHGPRGRQDPGAHRGSATRGRGRAASARTRTRAGRSTATPTWVSTIAASRAASRTR